MTADRWYNSGFGNGLGLAAFIVAIGLGGGGALFRGCLGAGSPTANEVAIEKAKYEHRLQEADLNNNGITDTFYVIDGRIALVELDGKPVSELYRR